MATCRECHHKMSTFSRLPRVFYHSATSRFRVSSSIPLIPYTRTNLRSALPKNSISTHPDPARSKRGLIPLLPFPFAHML
jgi:hypothetical protein